jgi:hypothetical protein
MKIWQNQSESYKIIHKAYKAYYKKNVKVKNNFPGWYISSHFKKKKILIFIFFFQFKKLKKNNELIIKLIILNI